ncbi:MAG: hypothetical protein ACJA0I_000386 [Gammaproteobacteria bacterium]|jgi:hypothetical protein
MLIQNFNSLNAPPTFLMYGPQCTADNVLIVFYLNEYQSHIGKCNAYSGKKQGNTACL